MGTSHRSKRGAAEHTPAGLPLPVHLSRREIGFGTLGTCAASDPVQWFAQNASVCRPAECTRGHFCGCDLCREGADLQTISSRLCAGDRESWFPSRRNPVCIIELVGCLG